MAHITPPDEATLNYERPAERIRTLDVPPIPARISEGLKTYNDNARGVNPSAAALAHEILPNQMSLDRIPLVFVLTARILESYLGTSNNWPHWRTRTCWDFCFPSTSGCAGHSEVSYRHQPFPRCHRASNVLRHRDRALHQPVCTYQGR